MILFSYATGPYVDMALMLFHTLRDAGRYAGDLVLVTDVDRSADLAALGAKVRLVPPEVTRGLTDRDARFRFKIEAAGLVDPGPGTPVGFCDADMLAVGDVTPLYAGDRVIVHSQTGTLRRWADSPYHSGYLTRRERAAEHPVINSGCFYAPGRLYRPLVALWDRISNGGGEYDGDPDFREQCAFNAACVRSGAAYVFGPPGAVVNDVGATYRTAADFPPGARIVHLLSDAKANMRVLYEDLYRQPPASSGTGGDRCSENRGAAPEPPEPDRN